MKTKEQFTQYLLDYESEITDRDFLEDSGILEEIRQLENINQVKRYYLEYRGWREDDLIEDCMDLLLDLIKEFPEFYHRTYNDKLPW